MEILRKFTTEKMDFPIFGENLYNTMVWLSIDGGKTYCHCGIGHFDKTEEAAKKWIEEYKKEQE